MLISDSTQRIIRVLLNRKAATLRDLAKKSGVSLGLTVRVTNDLDKTGYISKKGKLVVKQPEKLLKAWAYTVSINELEKIYFSAAERPQYLIKKIANIGNKNNLDYAFTLFAATELITPYVAPSEVHIYFLQKDGTTWRRVLREENIFPSEKGNIVCFLVDNSYLYNKQKIGDSYVVSLPQLYIDLFSYGGQGVEASEELLKAIKATGDFNV